MSGPNRISVVIPVRNGEAFVCEAIDSVLAQEGFEVEVIVVDNASTDGTQAVIRERFGDRVTLAEESRRGPASACNHGVSLAKGDALAFLDADDVWVPHKLARQTAAWREHPEADMVFSLGQEFPSPEPGPDAGKPFPWRAEPYALRGASAFLSRREVFLRVGALPDVPGGEFVAWYGLARTLGMRDHVVNEVLVRRRIHGANSSRSLTAGYPAAVNWLLEQRRARTNSVSSKP